MHFTTGFRKAARRLGMVAAALSLSAAGWFAIGPSGVAFAANNCSLGSSGGNIVTCINAANGVGSATLHVVTQAKVLQLCVTDDVGGSEAHLYCSGYRTVQPGGEIVSGQIRFTQGTWCAHAWRDDAISTPTSAEDFISTQVTQVCV